MFPTFWVLCKRRKNVGNPLKFYAEENSEWKGKVNNFPFFLPSPPRVEYPLSRSRGIVGVWRQLCGGRKMRIYILGTWLYHIEKILNILWGQIRIEQRMNVEGSTVFHTRQPQALFTFFHYSNHWVIFMCDLSYWN